MSSVENKMYSGLLTSLSESEKQPFKFDIWMRAHTNDRTDRACNQDTAESFIHFLSWKKKKKIWWREKTQCLMHLRTTLVCHLISKHWWHLRHSQLWIHYWSTTVNHCFVVVLHKSTSCTICCVHFFFLSDIAWTLQHILLSNLIVIVGSELHLGQNSCLHDRLSVNITPSAQ